VPRYRSAPGKMIFLSVIESFLGSASGSLEGSPLTLACFLACLSLSIDAINYTKQAVALWLLEAEESISRRRHGTSWSLNTLNDILENS